MKKLIFLSFAAGLLMYSCGSSQQSVRKVDINDTNLITEPKVVRYDVDLNKKLTGTVKMSKKYGAAYVKSAAIAEALKFDPTADLIVDPQYQINSGLLKMEVTVTGFHGKYTSVETLDTAYMQYYIDFNNANGASGGMSSPIKMKLFKKK